METPQSCHARAECFDVPKANVFRRFGCAIIRKTARKAKMSFSHARRQTVTMDNSVAANMSSTRHSAFHLITNVIWSLTVWMEVMNQSAVS